MDAFQNYVALKKRVDDQCRRIQARWAGHIACRKGCDDCCRRFGIFPVEAAAVRTAFEEAPPKIRAQIREQARSGRPDGPCPLLSDGACLLYEARPIICRTHGLPVLSFSGETAAVDVCPRNFTHVSELPGDAAIHLDRLNAAFAAVNQVFVASLGIPVPDRLSLSDALLFPREEVFGPA